MEVQVELAVCLLYTDEKILVGGLYYIMCGCLFTVALVIKTLPVVARLLSGC